VRESVLLIAGLGMLATAIILLMSGSMPLTVISVAGIGVTTLASYLIDRWEQTGECQES